MTALGGKRSALAVVPTINVTPLVDVVLVLLIIFMVVAPQLERDADVRLPSLFNVDPDGKAGEPFTVTMQGPGEYQFGEHRYDLDGVTAALEAAHAGDPLRRLALRADARLEYGEVRKLQQRLQAIGFPGFSYVVGQRHRWDEPEAAEPSAPEGAGG